MSVEKSLEKLHKVINETTGTALTISPKKDGWSGYLLQQKKSFEVKNTTSKGFLELLDQIYIDIEENRIKTEGDGKGKKNSEKIYKYKK